VAARRNCGAALAGGWGCTPWTPPTWKPGTTGSAPPTGTDSTSRPVDLRLTGGERLPLSELTLQVLHIPGHSPGSAAFLVESDQQRVLFGQDLHGPLHPALLSNRDQYQQSLRTLLALDADILCEGHHGIVAGKDSVAQFIDRYLED
jgi:glyoxylase-like metal-dependent hydrolase (beta-lactamase superfamily II)